MFWTGRKERGYKCSEQDGRKSFCFFFYIKFMVIGSGLIKVERSHILITERD